MNCHDARELLPAYSDNELDAVTSRDLEAHLQFCPDCEKAFAADRAVKTVIAKSALFTPAPDELRRQFAAPVHAVLKPKWRISSQLLNLAASIMIVVGLIYFAPGLVSHASSDTETQEVLASHLRSLQGDHLLDVPSTDQHTVKPYFNGRLDFSPPVYNLSAQGFPLVGGRLDYLHERPVAALVYHRAKHVINLFIWPGEEGSTRAEKQGYHLIHWNHNGMTFWAVSDLNEAELQHFADLFQAAAK